MSKALARSRHRDRIDFDAVRAAHDLRSVVEAELGLSRDGKASCPFHGGGQERTPSLHVYADHFHCYGCQAHGDVIDWVARRDGLSRLDAARELSGASYRPGRRHPGPPRVPPPPRPHPKPTPPPEGWQALARWVVGEAERMLWSKAEAARLTLDYLHRRGLADSTIRAARLGVWPAVHWRRGLFDKPLCVPRGIVIPWTIGEHVEAINIRRPDSDMTDGRGKYHMLKGSRRGGLYPGTDAIAPGRPLILAEGEFDCLLLAQEVGGLASVVTLGGAGDRDPEPGVLLAMAGASPWYIALDGDEAGRKAAAGWLARSGRCRRVEPPAGKDWTDARRDGFDLRDWWGEVLAGRPPEGFDPAWYG
jgi:DNA primase